MENMHQFNDATKLFQCIMEYVKKYRMRKIRFFERNLSYEDFSISYTLQKKPILNFTVEQDGDKLVVKKKDRRSTRHICFDKSLLCEVLYMDKHVPYMAIKVQGDLYYTDGSRRYEKEAA